MKVKELECILLRMKHSHLGLKRYMLVVLARSRLLEVPCSLVEMGRSYLGLVLANMSGVSIRFVRILEIYLDNAVEDLGFKTKELLTGWWGRSVSSRWCWYAFTWA